MVDTTKKLNNTTFNPHPKTGRCIHHPTIRLRKKKLFGRGWKIVIGHCPDCCLDEMKRMAVEMRDGSSNNTNNEKNGHGFNNVKKKKVKFDNKLGDDKGVEEEEVDMNRCISSESSSTVRTIYPNDHPIHQRRKDRSGDKKKKMTKKKHNSSRVKDDREQRRGKGQVNNSSDDHNDSMYSDLVNEDQVQRNLENHMKKQKHQQLQGEEGSGDATTGSTAPNSSTDGNASLSSTSEQQYKVNSSNNVNKIPSQREHPPPPPPPKRDGNNMNHHQNAPSSPPPPQKSQLERKMVLSIKYKHPKTGKRGTYTGEVLDINSSHPQLPDGKGTVYYADGSIEEGTWCNGLLIGDHKEYGLHQFGSIEEEEEEGSIIPGGGSLDKLYKLGGKKSRHALPRGSSASAQSYHSHGSHDDNNSNTNIPSGSASVQEYRRSNSGTSFASVHEYCRRRSSLENSSTVTSSHSKSSFAEEKGGNNNLDSLDRLGNNNNVPRGASASVQSYNSHGSKSSSTNIPTGGSASVQDYRASSSSMLDYRGGSVNYHSSSHRVQQHSQSMNAIGKGYRENGIGSGGLDTSGRSRNSTEQEDESSDDDDNYSSSSSSSSSSSNAGEDQMEAAKANQIMTTNELFGSYTKRKILGRPKALTSKDYAIIPISTKIPTSMQRPKKTSSSSSTKIKDSHSLCRSLVKDADSNATRTMRHLSDNLRSEIDRWVAHTNKVEYELDQVETRVINQCKHGKKLLTDNFNLLSDKQKLEDEMKKKDKTIKTMKRQLHDATKDTKSAEAKVKRLEQQVTKLQMQLLKVQNKPMSEATNRSQI